MQQVTDATIEALITARDAQQALHTAFASLDRGEAALQERERTEAGGFKLSTMGAVIPALGVAGAKVYTTIAGRFQFVILLFAIEDGRPLACMEAGAITRLRTAACSVLAARHLARPQPGRLALFGSGVQARAHAQQLAQAYPLDEIRLCSTQTDPRAAAAALQQDCGVPVRACGAAQALDGAELVVTATRATEPLFGGDALDPGSFVAAVGSSLPHARELDDRCLQRASRIAVEWLPQAWREAGELIRPPAGLLAPDKLVELGALVSGRAPGRQHDGEITVYKSVGVGLEDVALAGLAWQRLQAG